jgi:hypothetical protein
MYGDRVKQTQDSSCNRLFFLHKVSNKLARGKSIENFKYQNKHYMTR